MTLAEQLVLLALDPGRGVLAPGVDARDLRHAAAQGILVELMLHGRLAVQGDRLVLDSALPDFHPLLAEAGALLGANPRDPRDAAQRVASGIPGLVKRIVRSLVARDILHHQREAFFIHRYPVRSRQARNEVVDALRAVAEGRSQQPVPIALASLAEPIGVLATTFDAEQRARIARSAATADAVGAAATRLRDVLRLVRASGRNDDGR